ncbi:MAG: hypothetical protein V1866_04800 [archaeon]
MSLADVVKKATIFLKYNAVDTTSSSIAIVPVYGLIESVVIGMSVPRSRNSRLLAVGLGYAGFGYVFGKGRDLWRKHFSITDLTEEKKQKRYDRLYCSAYNAAISPFIYSISYFILPHIIKGLKEPKDLAQAVVEIAAGTAMAAVVGYGYGGPIGYAMDSYRDLTGIEKCERKSYPQWARRQIPLVKKAMAAGLMLASIGLNEFIYSKMAPLRNEVIKLFHPASIHEVMPKQSHDRAYLNHIMRHNSAN